MKTTNIFLILTLFSISFYSCNVIEKEVEAEPEPTSLKVGLIAHIPLNGNADDISATGLKGTVQGASIAEDRFGNSTGAFSFDGIDDLVIYDQPEKLALGGKNPYTITAWAKVTDLKERRNVIISKFNGGIAAGWYLGVSADSVVQTYRNASPWSTKGLTKVDPSQFVHYAATYDGTNLKVFVNGQLDGSLGFGSHPYDSKTNILIGGAYSRNEAVSNFKGTIDDVRIYDRVLDKEEIEWLAKN